MALEALLLAWSALALLWWGISWGLVRAGMRPDPSVEPAADPSSPSLTVFKPLAPLDGKPFDARGLISFLGQLGAHDEMLLGVHESDRPKMEPLITALRERFPQANWRVRWRTEPDAFPNPKIAWLTLLAPEAQGELWLWSDADIVAPPGFLAVARAEYAEGGARLVTWPYLVRRIAAAPALLDALFVNVDFFPGVLLLRAIGPVDFAFGAGMLFSRADFEANVRWPELGAALADDFELGQRLRPVRIGRAILTTTADDRTCANAIQHYLRWSKTVRWNRPGGTAARLIVLPVLGWLAFVIAHPGSVFGWLGLLGMMQVDVTASAVLCRSVGCGLRLRDLPALELWSLGRVLTWVLCWLPWPVVWSGRAWWQPIDKT